MKKPSRRSRRRIEPELRSERRRSTRRRGRDLHHDKQEDVFAPGTMAYRTIQPEAEGWIDRGLTRGEALRG